MQKQCIHQQAINVLVTQLSKDEKKNFLKQQKLCRELWLKTFKNTNLRKNLIEVIQHELEKI